MKLTKSNSERKAESNLPPTRIFAWAPKDLQDGSIVWLEYVWRKRLYIPATPPFRGGRFIDRFYKDKP